MDLKRIHGFNDCPYARAILGNPLIQLNISHTDSFKDWLLNCVN